MIINANRQDDTLTVIPDASVSEIIFDFEKLDYVSSAGLRVLLRAYKAMDGKGGIVIRNANALVRGVFNVTGFGDVFHFE